MLLTVELVSEFSCFFLNQFKHMLGRQFADPIVQRELSLLPYKVSEHPQTGRPIINMDYMGKTHEFTPEQVKKHQEFQPHSAVWQIIAFVLKL